MRVAPRARGDSTADKTCARHARPADADKKTAAGIRNTDPDPLLVPSPFLPKASDSMPLACFFHVEAPRIDLPEIRSVTEFQRNAKE